MTRQTEYIGNEAAAAYIGVGPSTWRAYVQRGQAPAPDRREIDGGHARPVWLKRTLDDWKKSRPGRGGRWAQG